MFIADQFNESSRLFTLDFYDSKKRNFFRRMTKVFLSWWMSTIQIVCEYWD